MHRVVQQCADALIFGGDSRTLYQVDPRLAAQLLGKPKESAVNIAYDAGEPLALLAVMRREPERNLSEEREAGAPVSRERQPGG